MTLKYNFKLISALFLTILIFSCKNSTKEDKIHFSKRYPLDLCINDNFVYDDFKINNLDHKHRPYSEKEQKFKLPKKYDKDSIILIHYADKDHYHPVAIANNGITLIENYLNYKDSTALRLAQKHADKLLEIALDYSKTLLFPYKFKYIFNEKDLMSPPWFSAMSQGNALSLFTRLYQITKYQKYLDAAHKTFKSLTLSKHQSPIWFSCIDKNNNLWFEEYPNIFPSHVLNGKIFTIYGIYDYFCLTKKETAKEYLLGGITTIKKNVEKYRNKGGYSYYSMKYDAINDSYHRIHVRQIKNLYKITNDEFFNTFSEALVKDVK